MLPDRAAPTAARPPSGLEPHHRSGRIATGPSMVLPALAFGLIGLLFLGSGLASFFWNRRVLPRYSEVGEGVVSGFTGPDDEGHVRPRVEFLHGGDTVTITGRVGSSPPAYKAGQKVTVRYPPDEPGMAVIADFQDLYLFQIALMGLGAAGVVVSALLFVVR